MFDCLKRTGTRLRLWERGSSLIAALGAMTAITTFSVAVTYGVSTNIGQSNRDRSAKRALAAAEAGAQEANYRMNMLQPTTDNPCVILESGVLKLGPAEIGTSWCPPQTTDLGTGASATYQISPISTSEGGVVTREVVSTGSVNGVSRRVEATVSTKTGTPLFTGYAVESNQRLEMHWLSSIVGAARSNDDIQLTWGANICGENAAATPGPGKEVDISWWAYVCGPTTPADSPFVLTPVDQGDAPTNNDNDRITSGADPSSGVSWNPSTRELMLNWGDHLTLGGHTYSLCRLQISGWSELVIMSGANVRIFFDSMENCGYSYGSQTQRRQLYVTGLGKIRNVNNDPRDLQIYMMGGSTEQENEAYLGGLAIDAEMLLYAPYSYVYMIGLRRIIGAVVANRAHMDLLGGVTYDNRAENVDESTVGVYRRQKYVECTPEVSGSMPDDGC